MGSFFSNAIDRGLASSPSKMPFSLYKVIAELGPQLIANYLQMADTDEALKLVHAFSYNPLW